MTAAVTSVPGTSTVKPLPTPSYSPVLQVVIDWFKDKPQDIAKTISYACSWAAMVDSNPLLGSVSRGTRDAKNFLCALEIPKKTNELATSARSFVTGPSIRSGRDVVEKVTNLFGSINDGANFGASVGAPVTPNVIKSVGLINSGGLILGKGSLAVGHVEKISALEGKSPNKAVLHVINLARDTSYIALGTLGVLAVAGGFTVAPWAFLASTTSALVWSIGGYFYERLADPEGKQFDKDKMIANLVAQRA